MSKFGDGRALFATRNQGQKSWRDLLTPDQREWFEWIADETEQWQRFPSWTVTQDNWRTNFPDDEAPSDKTLKRHLIEYLRETNRGEWLDK